VLAGTDLRGADLRYARLVRPRDLSRIRFRDARNLHLAQVKGTTLADCQMRELPATGQGDGTDLDHADLHGTRLAGASLRGVRLTDIINQTGNFSGSNVNVKSHLEHVTQAIGTLPDTDAATRAELARLTTELSALLQQVPSAQAAAEAVATLAGELIDNAAVQPRNPALLKASADALLNSARNLTDRVAPVLKVVEQVLRLLGLG